MAESLVNELNEMAVEQERALEILNEYKKEDYFESTEAALKQIKACYLEHRARADRLGLLTGKPHEEIDVREFVRELVIKEREIGEKIGSVQSIQSKSLGFDGNLLGFSAHQHGLFGEWLNHLNEVLGKPSNQSLSKPRIVDLGSALDSDVERLTHKLKVFEKRFEQDFESEAKSKLAALSEVLDAQKHQSESLREEIQLYRDSAKEMLGSVSNDTTLLGHKSRADKEEKEAEKYTGYASGCFIVVGVIAAIYLCVASFNTPTLEVFLYRTVSLGVLLLPGFYFASLASNHRQQAIHFTKLTLGMHAIGPYTSEFTSEERLVIKKKFAEAIFIDNTPQTDSIFDRFMGAKLKYKDLEAGINSQSQQQPQKVQPQIIVVPPSMQQAGQSEIPTSPPQTSDNKVSPERKN